MEVLYAVSCVASFLLIIAYCGLFKKRDIWFLLTFISVFICNVGYLTVAISHSLDEALLANRISYLGSVFLPFFLFMTIAKVCKCKYPHYLPLILTIINVAVLILTASIGYNDLYYTNISFVMNGSSGQLLRQYGPLHLLYYFYLISYFGAMISVIIRSFFKKRVVSYKHAICLAFVVLLNISIYFIEKIIHTDFEVISYSYVISELFLFWVYKELEDYDIDNILQSTFEIDSTGIMLFDVNQNFKGCNDDATAIFPELNNLKLEYSIPKDIETLQQTIIPVLNRHSKSENVTYRHGVKIYRIIAKPFHRNGKVDGKLLGTAIVISDDTAQQEYLQLISSYNDTLEKEVAEKTKHVLTMHDNLIRGMADMVEGRDPNTGGHIKRTSSVVSIFVRKLRELGYEGITESYCRNVAKAAPMHDLGKIAIDDAILRKPGKYTADEYAIMQTHASRGAEIVAKILKREDDEEFYDIAVNVAHYHHEKYNGKGYPEHLTGGDIPLEARIMALADVFDALVSKRCYKESYSYDEAFEIIRESMGEHFDPKLGEIFLTCKNELCACYDAQK